MKFRKPDYSTTDDQNAYLEAWHKLAEPMEKLGFILYCYDPDFGFEDPETKKIFYIPTPVVKKINANLK